MEVEEEVLEPNTNTNCLEGIRCPDCGQFHRFKIEGKAFFDVTDDGTGDCENVEWDSHSMCSCPECGLIGTFSEFREANQCSKSPQ